MKIQHGKLTLSLIALAVSSAGMAADAIDLSHAPLSTLNHLLTPSETNAAAGYLETSRHVDKDSQTHIRMQQTWEGYPIWGADAVLHLPHSAGIHAAKLPAILKQLTPGVRMNGTAWQNLQIDLQGVPAKIFTEAGANVAMNTAITTWQQKTGAHPAITRKQINRIIFVDKKNKAHWAWKIDFHAHTPHQLPAIPTFIIDATTQTVYKQWDNLQTAGVSGSGYGGNPQMGKLIYDGLRHNLPPLSIERDDSANLCYLKNDEVIVKDRDEDTGDTVPQFSCTNRDKKHNLTYWDGNFNSANGAYSPDNDALFIGHVVQKMYHDWYNIPALSEYGKPMKLIMRVHDFEAPVNAFWDGEEMTFGDGNSDYYPFTILNIGAHEISHGFTEQHSNLVYDEQSGGLNESFSDMAGAAADFYAYNKNSWQLGKEISKAGGDAFRFMDVPSKDCYGDRPGHYCSIDKASQYHDDLNVHFSSGVFNRAFYLLATTKGWDPHKAFDVMVKANQDYWVANTSFQQAACGVLSAATDLKYDTTAVSNALMEVELDTNKC